MLGRRLRATAPASPARPRPRAAGARRRRRGSRCASAIVALISSVRASRSANVSSARSSSSSARQIAAQSRCSASTPSASHAPSRGAEHPVARRPDRPALAPRRWRCRCAVPTHHATTSAIATSMRSPSPVAIRRDHAAQISTAHDRPALEIGDREARHLRDPGPRRGASAPPIAWKFTSWPGQVAQRPVLAEAGERAVDDGRVHGDDRVVAEPEPVRDARAPALAHDVGLGRELERARASRRPCAGRARCCACRARPTRRSRGSRASGRRRAARP